MATESHMGDGKNLRSMAKGVQEVISSELNKKKGDY